MNKIINQILQKNEYKIPRRKVSIDEKWVNKHIPKDVTKVICPDGLKEIGNSAFDGYEDLKEILFNENLEVIGKYAFKETGLKKIIIPSSVKKICSHAFCDCNNLTEIVLNEGLEEIGLGAFLSVIWRKLNYQKV